jgi:hypothetical protein
MQNNLQQPDCCPQFDPAPWDGKEFEWKDKLFLKDKVFTIMYMPLNFGAVMTRMQAKVEKANAQSPSWLCLSDHVSMWRMDAYLEVDREIPGAETVAMSGKFVSKVYEGDFSKTGEWMKDFDTYVKGKGLTAKKTYMWYTTCPKCAKKYGKNYVVVVGKVE